MSNIPSKLISNENPIAETIYYQVSANQILDWVTREKDLFDSKSTQLKVINFSQRNRYNVLLNP